MDYTTVRRKSLYRYMLMACMCGVQVSGAYAAIPDAVSTLIQQQEKLVTGRVLDKAGQPIIGATIVDKQNRSNGTITDLDGNYSIRMNENSVLVFSFVGYKSAEYKVSDINGKTVVLEEDALNLDEVVVTGYTSQKKADLTGSVSVVKVDQLKSGSYGSAMKAVQGKVAGMSVSTNVDNN